MVKILETEFTSYELTNDETIQAATLTNLQVYNMRNELSIALTKKNLLAYNPGNPDAFIKEHEYWRGWIECIRWTLVMHDKALEESKALAIRQTLTQSEE